MTTQPPPSVPIPISNSSPTSQGSLSPTTPFSMPTPRNFATSPSGAMFRWGFPGSLSKSPNAPSTIGSPPKEDGVVRHDRAVSIAGPGVLGDKQARGQGVLRRLSLGGGSLARPNFLSPPKGPSTALADSPPSTACPTPVPAEKPLPSPETVRRAATTGRRRLSENQGNKKRGVSPMGERILRDHGHF